MKSLILYLILTERGRKRETVCTRSLEQECSHRYTHLCAIGCMTLFLSLYLSFSLKFQWLLSRSSLRETPTISKGPTRSFSCSLVFVQPLVSSDRRESEMNAESETLLDSPSISLDLSGEGACQRGRLWGEGTRLLPDSIEGEIACARSIIGYCAVITAQFEPDFSYTSLFAYLFPRKIRLFTYSILG